MAKQSEGGRKQSTVCTLTITVIYESVPDNSHLSEILEKCREQGEVTEAELAVHKNSIMDLRRM